MFRPDDESGDWMFKEGVFGFVSGHRMLLSSTDAKQTMLINKGVK